MNLIFKLLVLFLALVGLTSFLGQFSKKPIIYTPKSYVVFHGSRDKKVVALTFDADMTPKMKRDLDSGKVKTWYNKEVINILKENKVPATLFLTGMWVEIYPNITKDIASNPLFELANHSYSHPSFSGKCFSLGTILETKDKEEIQKTQILLKNVAKVDNHLFRFPGGCYDKDDLEEVKKLGLTTVLWDVAGGDGFNQNTNSIISKVLKNTQNGSIIVLHMHGGPNAAKTAEALPSIISGLKERGFSFVKVSDLIR